MKNSYFILLLGVASAYQDNQDLVTSDELKNTEDNKSTNTNIINQSSNQDPDHTLQDENKILSSSPVVEFKHPKSENIE